MAATPAAAPEAITPTLSILTSCAKNLSTLSCAW